MSTDVTLGSWANAFKAQVECNTNGGAAGLLSAGCFEMVFPASASKGNTQIVEIEANCPASWNPSDAHYTSFLGMNVNGTTAGEFDDHCMLMDVQGLSAGSGHLLSAASNTLRIKVGSDNKYLVLSSEENSLTMTSSGTLTLSKAINGDGTAIDFTGVVTSLDDGRDSNYIRFGKYNGGSTRAPIAIAALNQTFAPIQMHFDIQGTSGSGGSFRPFWIWTKINTADQTNTSVYGIMHYLEVQKNCTDLYAAFHQIVFNAASGTQTARQVNTIHGALNIAASTTVNMDQSASHGMCGVLGSLTGAGATSSGDRAYALSGIVDPTCTYATAAINAWVDGTAQAVHYDYIAPGATVTNGWLDLLDNAGSTAVTTSSAVDNVGTKGWIKIVVNGVTRYIALGDGVS